MLRMASQAELLTAGLDAINRAYWAAAEAAYLLARSAGNEVSRRT
jgi:hypothetical protein